MRCLTPILACLFLVPLMAAAPDTFTRADLEALEAERQAAVAELERLESEGQTTELDIHALDTELLSAAMEASRREEQASRAEETLVALRVRRGEARSEL